jgi:hypothetical protein
MFAGMPKLVTSESKKKKTWAGSTHRISDTASTRWLVTAGITSDAKKKMNMGRPNSRE